MDRSNNYFASAESIRKNAGKYPENLIFYDSECLKEVLTGRGWSEKERVNVIGELLVRGFFSGFLDEEAGKEVKDVIREKYLKNGELSEFYEWLPFMHKSYDVLTPEMLERQLWTPPEGDSLSRMCLDEVRRRLNLLFKCEGFIPVCLNGRQGRLLPFHFESGGQVPEGVYDLEGKELFDKSGCAQWSHCLRLLELSGHPRVVVHFHQVNVNMSADGNSLMLPLKLAWLRKTNEVLPYVPFSVVATGAIDEHGLLVAVDGIEEKYKAAQTQLYHPLFVYPRSRDGATLLNEALPLDCNVRAERALEQVRVHLEKTKSWIRNYAVKHLAALIDEVRTSNYRNWDELIKRLKNADMVDENCDLAYKLSILALRSEAYCHSGQTDQAYMFIEEGERLLRDCWNGDEKIRKMDFLFKIERLVVLTDRENFEEILRYGLELEKCIGKLNDNDLLMRFCGTMGQANAYAALAGFSGGDKDKALKYIDGAIRYANKLGKEEDIAQDLNYKFLYYALFQPESEKSEAAYRCAYSQAAALQHSGSAQKNRLFLYRIRMLSKYRYLLQTGECNEFTSPNAYLQEMGDGWLKSATAKYLGALSAASGKTEEAEKYFAKALSALGRKEDEQGVLGVIKLTVYAEAFRSLHDECYRKNGMRLLKCLEDDNKGKPAHWTLPLWRQFLEKGKPVDFPGLKYWY